MIKLVSTIILAFFAISAHAHSGRTNSEGCHSETRTGGYHCH